jgi:hypothetical protein
MKITDRRPALGSGSQVYLEKENQNEEMATKQGFLHWVGFSMYKIY